MKPLDSIAELGKRYPENEILVDRAGHPSVTVRIPCFRREDPAR